MTEEYTGPTIQERTLNKTHELLGEVEGLFDNYIKDWADRKNYSFLYNVGVKPIHAKAIISHAENEIKVWNEALMSEDEQMKEAYSCYTKTQMRKCITWWGKIIEDCNRIIEDGKFLRKDKKFRKKLTGKAKIRLTK